MAKDGYNREIDYLRVSVTDRCNLGCVYCISGGERHVLGQDEILSASEVETISKAAMDFGVRKIRLTGGEPLLREDILDIVARVKRTGVKDLSLTTNGLLLNEMARSLREAGLDRVNISLDTLRPERYAAITGGGGLGEVMEAIDEAERAGLNPVKINMVPIRGLNDDEIPDFARLTIHRPLHVRFIEFMPSRKNRLWDEEKCVRSSEARDVISSALGPLERLRFKGRGPSRNYRPRDAKGLLGFISPVSHSFCYRCSRLRVSAAGRVRPCLFSRTEVDLLTPMRAGAGLSEISRLFGLAIEAKPEGNYLKEPSPDKAPDFSSIGG